MPKIVPEYNKFDGIFSDSDDDNEVKNDYVEDEVMYRVQEKHENILRSFKEFMNNPDFITNKGDPKTNIVDRYCLNGNSITTRTYNVPHNKIDKMFKYLEICRRKNLKMMVYEKQLEMSGFMIDFDIYQNDENCRFNDGLATSLLLATVKLLMDYIDFEPVLKNGKYSLYIAITKKPRVMYNSDKQCFKDGLHILIPGVKLNRETKRMLLDKAIEKEYYKDMIRHYPGIKGLTFNDFIDKNSAHVPVHFFGNITKLGSPPYILFGVYEYDIYPGDKEPSNIISKCDKFNDENNGKPVVVIHELSLNWEKSGGVIKKQEFFLKDEYVLEVNKYKTSGVTINDDEKMMNGEYGELSLLKMHDPDAGYVIDLLDTLHISRAIEYNKWFKVLCLLANEKKEYKPLAEYFSKKCPEKYTPESFNYHWGKACSLTTKNISMGSLYYWAEKDNPEKYGVLRSTSMFDTIFKKIYDPQTEGKLQNYDVAELLYKSLRHKYVFDCSGKGTWYEFILPGDLHTKGQVYKWKQYDRAPNSLKRYISEKLPLLFRKIHDKISSIIENLKSDKEITYHNTIKRNFQMSAQDLRRSAFKNGVMCEAEQVFERVGFTKNLDNEPLILGVGNGIIKLGPVCELITGYHNYAISKFTTTDYAPFNPRNPITKKLLIALRNMFPDDEPDTFEFMMHYLASALDAKKKESILLLLVGNGSNGKSFLMELFKETVGEQFVVKMNLSFLTSRQKNAEGATPALMSLIGARMATYSETEESELLHSAKIKEITGQETLGGRKIYGDFINFKPTCHHVVTSNYDFEVNSTDHGTWRRLKHVSMKIQFGQQNKDLAEQNGDPSDQNNNYERLVDPSMGASWPDNPEVRTAFLGVLVYYYESLQRNYGGLVENVPHPTIKRETEEFRNRQDKINNFINARIVKTIDPNIETPISTIIEKYCRWYDSLYPNDRNYKKAVVLQFENSRLRKIIKKSKIGNYIKGYRALDNNEPPETGETYFMDNFIEKSEKNIKLTPENSEQFYERMCQNFDLYIKDKNAAYELEMTRKKMLEKEIDDFDEKEAQNEEKQTGYKKNNDSYEIMKYDRSGYRINHELAGDPDLNDFINEASSGEESDGD